MKNFNRRTFLASLSPLVMLPFYQQSIDLILYNANIITVNPNQPSAQAIAMSSDKIIAVGTNESILKLATGFTKKIDISGKTILPGFIDSHSHPASSGRAHLRNVDCDLRSISAIKKVIYERTKNTPEGEWVEGFKYDDTKTSEKRFINNKDLDEVSPHHPVIIRHRGGHTAYVNSMALTLGGIDRNTADPLGGHIERDAISGELTGRLLESATSAIENLIPKFDNIIIVGGMANNILSYKNFPIGKSIHEENCNDIIKNIFETSKKYSCSIIYPDDVVTGRDFDSQPVVKELNNVQDDDMILDIGPNTIKKINTVIKVPNLGDHRICMSTVILSLVSGIKSEIKNFETVRTSSPSFLQIIKSLGGRFEIKKKF